MDTVLRLVGNAAGAPVLRRTSTGLAVCEFNVCAQESRRLPDGSFEKGLATWYRVTAWRALAENVAASVRRGDQVIVIGSVGLRPWEDKNGKDRLSLEVAAQHVGLSLRWRSATSGSASTTSATGSDALVALLDSGDEL